MKQQFFEFIEAPGLETYLTIRELVLAHPGFDPYSDDLTELLDLLEAGEYVQVQEGVSRAMPNLLLSPRAHMLAAIAAERTGEEKAADVEKYIAQTCVKGILATGEGSRESPYVVVRTSDEYDVLQYLDLQPDGQALLEVEEKHFDVIQTHQGREVVFDISAAYAKLQTQLDNDSTGLSPEDPFAEIP